MKTKEPDEHLAAAAQTGDTEALSALVDRHYRKVYALAYSALGDRCAAEDIAQEAFLVAYTNLIHFANPLRFNRTLLCNTFWQSAFYYVKAAKRSPGAERNAGWFYVK